MPVQVLHGIRSNSNSLRSSILPPPKKPKIIFCLWKNNFRLFLLLIGFLLSTSLSINANLFNFTLICMDSNEEIKKGITYAADFAALGILCTQWAPLNEHGLFLSLASSFSPASISIANFLSGIAILTSGLVWICWLNAFAELLPGVFIMQYKDPQ
uniref:Transmembrane protein 144 n=1 Tax=Meloidogyne hapla TaxID=6305 RepID=A0A1I8AZG7_MELHA